MESVAIAVKLVKIFKDKKTINTFLIICDSKLSSVKIKTHTESSWSNIRNIVYESSQEILEFQYSLDANDV